MELPFLCTSNQLSLLLLYTKQHTNSIQFLAGALILNYLLIVLHRFPPFHHKMRQTTFCVRGLGIGGGILDGRAIDQKGYGSINRHNKAAVWLLCVESGTCYLVGGWPSSVYVFRAVLIFFMATSLRLSVGFLFYLTTS
jgi:hypothetical protein